MSPTRHACAQRFGETMAPAVDPCPPQEAPMVKKKRGRKNKKTKSQDETNAVQVKIPWVLTTLGNLLDYVQDWIPGYHFAKRVVNNLYRRSTSPTASLTIFSVYTVTSSDPIVSMAKKERKRPTTHKKKPTSTTTPASPVQKSKEAPKPKLPLPQPPSRRTCRDCHQVFESRNELFRHINMNHWREAVRERCQLEQAPLEQQANNSSQGP
ncbi:hypothetical protein QBC45DRAFT_367541 [Copromyces sp. CBS 386.78]|nr:hypothetical protein QBC45DRAFT_367541 [Copromyces sp. CBS 386.78]